MPLYIGDYLADTMHLTTEQHGAYLLLIFHLWRRGTLPDDDALLGKISGLATSAWRANRPVLAEFFKVSGGVWTHSRVERERALSEARRAVASLRGKKGAAARWDSAADASSMFDALPGDGSSSSSSSSPSQIQVKTIRVAAQRVADARHVPFRGVLAEYWRTMNPGSPEMPWQGRDAKALCEFLRACPLLNEAQFRQMLSNRAHSAVAHGDRVYLWIANLTRFQEEITVYNKPASAGGGHASRAEINRDSVFHAVERALSLARGSAGGAGDPGAEPPAFAEPGMPAVDGAGPGRRALALVGESHHGVAARDAADGQAGRDGSLSYGETAAVTSGVVAVGG